MINLLEKFNNKQMKMLIKKVPEFRSGDDLKVTFKIVDGASERIQIFEGVCISKRNRGKKFDQFSRINFTSYLMKKLTFAYRSLLYIHLLLFLQQS